MSKALTYSGALVHQHDRDRFRLSLFAPAACRPALWALYAFNYEIARTRETVSNTTLGLIRLQWWRDAFAAVYQGAATPVHEILKDLAPAIRQHDLPRDLFERLLYAREFDLEDTPPGNLQGLENYADFTGTPLLQLALKIAGQGDGGAAPVAKAYAITGLLRAVAFHAGQHRCYLPADLLAAEGTGPEDIYLGRIAGVQPVVRKAAKQARTLLAGRRPEGRLARVMARQTALWLGHIEALDFDVFDSRINLLPPFYALRLLINLSY